MSSSPEIQSNDVTSSKSSDFERPTRVLMIEDDVTMEPLWRYVIEVARPGAVIEWLTTGEAAEQRIRQLGVNGGAGFSLIISDIFLNGDKTGLDIWESSRTDSFILMSVLTPQRLATLALNMRHPLPSYLQKPLDPDQCIETVRAMLQIRG
jgi:DNA-binding NtrC family response regulator